LPAMPRLPALSVLALIAVGAGMLALWFLSGTLLIVFVAVLLAAVLHALIDGLGLVLPVPRPIRFGLVTIGLFVGIGLAIAYAGPTLVMQANMLIDMLEGQRERLQDLLTSLGVTAAEGDESASGIGSWLPSLESIFSHAGMAFGMTLGIIGNTLVVLFLAIFLASDPANYRDSVVRLFPVSYRPRMKQVLDMAGVKLRWWLVSQLVLMVAMGVATYIVLRAFEVENAILLAVVTGMLNFIPYLGPILAGIPIFFAVLGQDPFVTVAVVILYLAIQNIEGYVLAPLVQKRVVKLPPGWSMLMLAVMGTLFGALGIAVAIPLFAVARLFVRELYIKDVLEREMDPAEDDALETELQSMRPARVPSEAMR
jgi:predicted PurR-regulated permease PerM